MTPPAPPPRDRFEFQFNSLGILPFPAPRGMPLPYGVRLNPGVLMQVSGFFLELNVETGVYNEVESPIGLDYYENHGSHALTPPSPFLLVQSLWGDPAAPGRFHLGVRSFSAGWRFDNGIQLRVGPHYYEQTEFDNFFTNQGYAPGAEYAKVWIPLGVFNGEFRFERSAATGTFREGVFSAAVMGGADGTVLGLTQGLLTLGLGQPASAPQLSLTAFGVVRSNPANPARPELTDPGLTYGIGGGAWIEHGIFAGGIGLNFQHSSSRGAHELEALEERFSATLLASLNPGNFRFRGALFLLSRTDSEDLRLGPARGMNETNLELTAGYQIVDGLAVHLGYRGAYGRGYDTHMGFIGLQTYFQGIVPIRPVANGTSSTRPRAATGFASR